MEKMELIKPGIYKKTVRGQKFNNTIKNTFQNLQERIENLKEIKPTGKMLKEKSLQPKLRKSMLLRAFQNPEKNLISSTPYHKNTQQFFENTCYVPISPINVNHQNNAQSNSSEVISGGHESNDNECQPRQDSSLIYVSQESPEKESASLRNRRSLRKMTMNRNKKMQEADLSCSPKRRTCSPKQRTPSPKQCTPSKQHISNLRSCTPSPVQHTPPPTQHSPPPIQHTPSRKQQIPSPKHQTPSLKQNSVYHRNKVQEFAINQSHNSPQHVQLKHNKLSKIPVRKKSLETLQNSHRHDKEYFEDADNGFFENVHKSRSDNCSLEQSRHSYRRSLDMSQAVTENMQNKSVMAEDNSPEDELFDDDECIKHVNNTTDKKGQDINRNGRQDENEKSGGNQRKAMEKTSRSVALSPIDFPDEEESETPLQQSFHQISPMSMKLNKSVGDKRELLHRTLERLRLQSNRSTQITPTSLRPNAATKNRTHLRLMRTQNTFNQKTQTSVGVQADETSSTVSEPSFGGIVSKLASVAHDSKVENVQSISLRPNIYESLMQDNVLQMDFGDTNSDLNFSSSAIGKPWRMSSGGVLSGSDSIKLNFIRSENQIRASQLVDNDLDDYSLSDSDIDTTRVHDVSPSVRSNTSKVTIMQTGLPKRQYNKKRRSRLVQNRSRKSDSQRQSNRKSLRKNNKVLTPNSIESGLDTDTAVQPTIKQLFSATRRSRSGDLCNTENLPFSISSADARLLGVRPLASAPKKTKDKVTNPKDKIKESNEIGVNTRSKQLKGKESIVPITDVTKDKNSSTTIHAAEHHSQHSPDISRHTKIEHQQKPLETDKSGRISSNTEAADDVLSPVANVSKQADISAVLIDTNKDGSKIRNNKKQKLTSPQKKNWRDSTKRTSKALKSYRRKTSGIKSHQTSRTIVSQRLSRADIDKITVLETEEEVASRNLSEKHQSQTEKDLTLQRSGTESKERQEKLEPPKKPQAKTKRSVSKKKLSKPEQQMNIIICDSRPKRERRPVRYLTDIIITEDMVIKPKVRKQKLTVKDQSDKRKKGKGDRKTVPDQTTIQKEAHERMSLPVEQDTAVTKKVPKSRGRPKGKKTNKGSSTVMAMDKKHLESTTVSSSRQNISEKELPEDVNYPERQRLNSLRHSSESIAQENLVQTNNTLTTNEIIPPPKTQDSTSFCKTIRSGGTLDSGFVTMKKNVSTRKSTLANESGLSGVKHGFITKSDKKRNIAKSVTDKILRVTENLPISSVQYDTTVNSYSDTLNNSCRRLTGAELINDDYITYVFNNKLCSIKYLSRIPSDSEYKTYQNIHVKEFMKDPSGICSSGYIKLNPGDQKRPCVAAKYSFFYNVISGSATIQLHNKTNMVYQGNFFFVPLGIEYSIRNIANDLPLILHYVKIKGY